MTSDDIAEIAAKLTGAQRKIVATSEPGGWGRDDAGYGVELRGGGQVSAARALGGKGLGCVEDHYPFWPRFLYFNNSTGLAVRAHLLAQESQHEQG